MSKLWQDGDESVVEVCGKFAELCSLSSVIETVAAPDSSSGTYCLYIHTICRPVFWREPYIDILCPLLFTHFSINLPVHAAGN